MKYIYIVFIAVLLFSCENKKVEPVIAPIVSTQAQEMPVQVTPVQKLLGVHTVVPKDTLWWISDKWYKDPVLWPAIYEINKDQIKDPDLIFEGQKFDIPSLNLGGNLSPEDKTLLSAGYLEAYRVYKEKGKVDAEDYKVVGDSLSN